MDAFVGVEVVEGERTGFLGGFRELEVASYCMRQMLVDVLKQ